MANIQSLRPYQQAARDSIHAQWEQGRLRTLLVLPTGTGKTIVFASVAADQVRAGDRVLILAHRGELLEQAADKLQRSTGLVSAVEKAESTCLNSWFRVVVGSVQTLQRSARLERFPRDYFGTIIIDEAHHAITDGYRRILDYFESAKVLGVTATPDRGDMRNLGEVFDSLAYEYKLTDAIKEGYLCKIMAQTIPLQLDISEVGFTSGDYSLGQLGTALDPYLEQIAAEMAQRCKGRKTVVFLPLIKTSQKFRDILNENGYIQELMIGSQKEFAGTDKFFLQHGFDKICDINSLKQEYSFKSNELNQWGLDDYKLFELAKNEITQLAQTGKFNFTMATIDCHMPKGFLCKYCPNTYENRYENIYACQSKLINSFIDWCKSQSWYENTTIVLVGDHPTMAQKYVNDVPSTYQRTTYNCFINSKSNTSHIKNRQFTHMDMYPTTLAAMGFNIEGNKLALGTNLFSELPTIIEKYGQDYINEEVQKSSEYLDKNIYQFN